jgi:hypothetical protein
MELSHTPRSRTLPSQRNSDPIPTNTVPGELHQIHAYAAAIKTRVEYLQGLIEPTALDEITEIKRVMKDTHRILERLQRKASEHDANFDLSDVTVQAWQAYQKLVKMEERLRRPSGEWGKEREVEASQPISYVPTGAQRLAIERVPMPTGFEEDLEEGEEVYVTRTLGKSWLADPEVEETDDALETGLYMMSGGLPSPYSQSNSRIAEEPDRSPISKSENEDEPDEDGTGLMAGGPVREVGGRNGVRKLQKTKFSHHLTRTRAEVEQSCEEEEGGDLATLRDPDRQREGSMSGYYATLYIMCGINDAAVVLPKLRFIKIHEVRELRTWLTENKYIKRSDGISRMEKLLQLLILLQEGYRIEKLAVLFSRTPNQVHAACREVMSGLLELHSETLLPRRQPTCDGLWKISVMFFNTDEVVSRATGYYGWDMMDLIKVLVTLNVFIGRYRQQGQFSLIGPYFHWWRSFHEVRLEG